MTSRPFSPWTRAVPPYQQRLCEAARTRATAVDKGQGRRERRTVIATAEWTRYPQTDWEDLGQVYPITREGWEPGKHTAEVAYRVTSHRPEQANAARLLELDGAIGGSRTACTTSAT